MKRLSIALFALALCVPFLAAQDILQTGAVEGTVVDMDGIALPGVAVNLSGPALLRPMDAVTTAVGTFRFILVPVGTYDVSFTLTGFQTLTEKGVGVMLRRTSTLRVVLDVSAVQEHITVVGEAPVVDIKSSTIGANFTTVMLQKLPTARDPWVIMQMAPGMVMDRENIGGSTSGSQSSGYAHGTLRSQTAYNIDGVNMVDAAASGATAMYFDFDAFEEIQVATGAHQADVLNSGVVLNMITKSGGNKFSGGFSLYGENDKLQSVNVPADDPAYANVGTGNPLDYYFEYGGDIGGPIIKDKLWFYGSFRDTEISRFIIGFALNGVPQTEYSALTHGTFKLTYQLSDNNKLMGWMYYDNKKMPHRSGGYTRPPETTFVQDSPSWFYHLEDTWTLSSNFLLNFKLGINKMWYQNGPQASVDMNSPSIRIYYTTPITGGYNTAYYNYTWYYSDRYSVNAYANYFADDFLGGQHEVKVGFEYSNAPFHTTRKYPGNHLLYFDNPDRTGAYQVWTFRNVVWDQSDIVYSGYINDVFSLKKHWTFSLGLRLDSTHMNINASDVGTNQWVDYYYANRMPTATPINHQDAQKDVVAFLTLSPRIGVTYDLFDNGNSVFKAHFARYAYQVSYDPAYRAIATGTWEIDYSWTDTNGDKMAQTNELGSIKYTSIAQTTKIDPNIKSPYTNEFVGGYEMKLARNFGIGLNFIWRETTRFWYSDNLLIDPATDYTPVTVQDPGPDGTVGTSDDGAQLTVYNLAKDKVGQSQVLIKQQPGYKMGFSGVEFTVNKRYSDRWQFMGSVTYGKTKIDLPLEAVDDPNNRIMQDGQVDTNDATWIVKASGSYDLPWGFYFGANFSFRSGYPVQRYFQTLTSLLNQGRISVQTEKVGASRYPGLYMLDLRLSKIFDIGKFGKLELMLDGFNLFNAYTTLGWNNQSGSSLHAITSILSPRILRLGVKWAI
jgi:hypothetical protein